jgi:hypothetical protein
MKVTFAFLFASLLTAAPPGALPPGAADLHILTSLAFEKNLGQFDRRVEFVFRAADYSAFFLNDCVAIAFAGKDGNVSTMSMRLCGRGPQARIEGLDSVAVKTSYFHGKDASKWVRDVPHYPKLRYRGVYPGVDLVFRWDAGGVLEYDWMVAPGADASVIRIRFDREVSVAPKPNGDITAAKDGFVWRHRKPTA